MELVLEWKILACLFVAVGDKTWFGSKGLKTSGDMVHVGLVWLAHVAVWYGLAYL